MPPRKKKKKPSKYKYESYNEPVCFCSKCELVHLRKERVKFVPEGNSKYLSVLVCPKCGGMGYSMVGEEELKRRKKTDE